MRLKAIKDHRYAGVNFRSGETYEATKGDAFVLVGAKLSEYAKESEIAREVLVPRTKEMVPETKSKEKNKKLKYKQRRYI